MEPPRGGELARTLHVHRLQSPGPQALGTTTVLVPTVCHHPAAANWRELITGVQEADLEQGSCHAAVINEAEGLIFRVAGMWGVPGGRREGDDGAGAAPSP